MTIHAGKPVAEDNKNVNSHAKKPEHRNVASPRDNAAAWAQASPNHLDWLEPTELLRSSWNCHQPWNIPQLESRLLTAISATSENAENSSFAPQCGAKENLPLH